MSAMASTPRTRPNILVTGTPGTGKTTTSALVAEKTGLTHRDVGAIVKAEGCHEGWDEEHQCYTLDDDKLVDALEPLMEAGGNVVDFHTCDVFPERWFDLVLVLRSDNTVLYDRLAKRGYAQAKLAENVECEIMQTVLEEARESYDEQLVVELRSDTVAEMDANVERVGAWLQQWKADNA